ncbi:hypothetical protein [Tahibacter sp.]|uniref:ArnT family glycosyltransferase n=1 Tax=Tahibacter sp. TaxID=2056211 RepID=UPI0028C4B0FC|nr:hypothetical protein [Tahibacter sp.]
MALWLVVVPIALFQHSPLPWASTRTLGIAWEMWNQNQFLVPLSNGRPDPSAMPLMFWLVHAGWAVAGVNDVWPRLLQAALGLCWLALSAALARRGASTSGAVAQWVPWMLVAMALPHLAVLQITEDLLTAVCAVGAFYALSGRPAWCAFVLALSAGLLATGPLMLGYVAVPLLLGPWWNAAAQEDSRRWYRRARLSVVCALGLFLAWAGSAGAVGGAGYRLRLMTAEIAQTVADTGPTLQSPAFAAVLAALLFPWMLWPRLWRAVLSARGTPGSAHRFAVAVVAPGLVMAVVAPGAQLRSVVAVLPVACIALVHALAHQDAQGGGRRRAWGPWPIAVLLGAAGISLAWLVPLLASRPAPPAWLQDLASHGAGLGMIFAVFGVLLLALPRGTGAQMRTIATVAFLSLAVCHGLFAWLFAPFLDVRPAAELLARAARAGQPVAQVGRYREELHFYARLQQPVAEIAETEVLEWARAHPTGLLVHRTPRGADALGAGALYARPFGRHWMVVWPAASFLTPAPATTAAHPVGAAAVSPAGASVGL